MFLASAILGSLLLNTSVLMQAFDARHAPAELVLRPGLLFHLLRKKWWLLGTGFAAVSSVLQIVALSRLSVAVVQSISAGGVLLMPLWSWVSQRQALRWPAALPFLLILGGVTVGALTVPAEGARVLFAPWKVVAISGVCCALAFSAARRRPSAALLSVASGLGFAASTLLQKVLALAVGLPAQAMAAAFLVVTGAAGFLAEMSALRQGSPLQVAPIVLAVSSVLPIMGARALFAERWPHPALTLVALALALAGSVFISATHREVEPRLA